MYVIRKMGGYWSTAASSAAILNGVTFNNDITPAQRHVIVENLVSKCNSHDDCAFAVRAKLDAMYVNTIEGKYKDSAVITQDGVSELYQITFPVWQKMKQEKLKHDINQSNGQMWLEYLDEINVAAPPYVSSAMLNNATECMRTANGRECTGPGLDETMQFCNSNITQPLCNKALGVTEPWNTRPDFSQTFAEVVMSPTEQGMLNEIGKAAKANMLGEYINDTKIGLVEWYDILKDTSHEHEVVSTFNIYDNMYDAVKLNISAPDGAVRKTSVMAAFIHFYDNVPEDSWHTAVADVMGLFKGMIIRETESHRHLSNVVTALIKLEGDAGDVMEWERFYNDVIVGASSIAASWFLAVVFLVVSTCKKRWASRAKDKERLILAAGYVVKSPLPTDKNAIDAYMQGLDRWQQKIKESLKSNPRDSRLKSLLVEIEQLKSKSPLVEIERV